MIELKNIIKVYNSNKILSKALDDISVSFRDKEFVSILGPSGCGKTTLLNIIGGLDKKTSGTLSINNVDTINYKDKDWDQYRNNEIGFVFQSFNLINNITVLENVELSLTLSGKSKKERIKKAKEALANVGLLSEINKKPNQLSGGQMQRVAIARSIVNDPKIILADEPTGALDTKTSIQILNILKEIAKDRLVIMVTHNKDLAEKYSSRIINLLDGKIISDSNPVNEKYEITSTIETKKTSMPFYTAIKLSFKNLLSKITRTMLTILAGSIGIIGVGLVLAVSNGVTIYIDDVQRVALGNYPITVSSSVKTSPEVSIYSKLEEFPDDNKVTIVKGNSKYEHINTIEDEFFDYLEGMDKSLYSLINYGTTIKMNMIYKNDTAYQKVTTSYFYEMTENTSYVNKEYSVLSGKIPESAEEIALVVDSYNCINVSLLYYLGMDYEDIESLSFEDILNIEIALIANDDFYIKVGDIYYSNSRSNYENLYNNAIKKLKVVGILRIKQNATSEIYSSGFLYTKALTDFVYENAQNSKIVTEQIANGYNKSVTTGEPFEDVVSLSSTQYKSYQYESLLYSLGAIKQINRFYIYTEDFASRLEIEKYIKAYSNDESNVKLSYSDYTSRITNEFSTFVTVLTKVLIIFASISLVVSSIMIAVITYISVIERTKEIGILRSIGARRKDISRVFTAETCLIGLASGITGIMGMYLLSSPINKLVKNIIANNTSLTTGLSTFNVVKVKPEFIVILLVGSVIITVLAGLIPSIIAAFKSPIKALKNE